MPCHARDGVNYATWRKDEFESSCKGGHFNTQGNMYEDAKAEATYSWGTCTCRRQNEVINKTPQEKCAGIQRRRIQLQTLVLLLDSS